MMDAMRTLFKLSSRSDSHLEDEGESFQYDDQLFLNLDSEYAVAESVAGYDYGIEYLYHDMVAMDEGCFDSINNHFCQVQEIDVQSLRTAHIEAIESIRKINMVDMTTGLEKTKKIER